MIKQLFKKGKKVIIGAIVCSVTFLAVPIAPAKAAVSYNYINYSAPEKSVKPGYVDLPVMDFKLHDGVENTGKEDLLVKGSGLGAYTGDALQSLAGYYFINTSEFESNMAIWQLPDGILNENASIFLSGEIGAKNFSVIDLKVTFTNQSLDNEYSTGIDSVVYDTNEDELFDSEDIVLHRGSTILNIGDSLLPVGSQPGADLKYIDSDNNNSYSNYEPLIFQGQILKSEVGNWLADVYQMSDLNYYFVDINSNSSFDASDYVYKNQIDQYGIEVLDKAETVLEEVSLQNSALNPAISGSDIKSLKIVDQSGVLIAENPKLVGDLYIFKDINKAVSKNGLRIKVIADISLTAENNKEIKFEVPKNAVKYISNILNGPSDKSIINKNIQKIDSLAPSVLNLNYFVENNQVTLNWDASEDAIFYHIYRASSPYEKIATTDKTSYIDSGLEGGKNYLYKVLAEDAAGNVSALSASEEVSVLVMKSVLPQTKTVIYSSPPSYEISSNYIIKPETPEVKKPLDESQTEESSGQNVEGVATEKTDDYVNWPLIIGFVLAGLVIIFWIYYWHLTYQESKKLKQIRSFKTLRKIRQTAQKSYPRKTTRKTNRSTAKKRRSKPKK